MEKADNTPLDLAATREQEQLRRSQIMSAVVECVAEGGIDGATIRRVAERAGVSTGMVSYYFPSKRELVAETIASATAELTRRLDEEAGTQPGQERLHKGAELVLINPGEGFPPVSFWMEFWAAATRDSELRNRFLFALERNHENYRNALKAEAEQGNLRDGIEPEMAINLLSALIRGLRIEACLGPEVVSREVAVNVLHFALGLIFHSPTESCLIDEQNRTTALDVPDTEPSTAAHPPRGKRRYKRIQRGRHQ